MVDRSNKVVNANYRFRRTLKKKKKTAIHRRSRNNNQPKSIQIGSSVWDNLRIHRVLSFISTILLYCVFLILHQRTKYSIFSTWNVTLWHMHIHTHTHTHIHIDSTFYDPQRIVSRVIEILTRAKRWNSGVVVAALYRM